MEHLYDIYKTLIKKVNTSFTRYLMDEINWKSRLIAITGARGTGKTTLMLQRIVLSQKVENSLYASVDNVYFSRHSII
ncbi:MAG: ATP-binding protein, partial [Bacteroidales bacterium]|nr:ATP-binding protein [Bacteroidales bacterium]